MTRPLPVGQAEARRAAQRQSDERLLTALQSRDGTKHWPKLGHTDFDLPDDFAADICDEAEAEHRRRIVGRMVRRALVVLAILGVAVIAGHGLLFAWRL